MKDTDKTLPIDLNTFGFVTREKIKGKILKNKCGRDFLYYVLTYYVPTKFNSFLCNPVTIEQKRLFGIVTPSWLVWTCLPFYKVPRLLHKQGLVFYINNLKINSLLSFIRSILLPKKIDVDQALSITQKAIDNEQSVGIDISIKWHGLFDHVMFVYGYDNDNLYVFDTHKSTGIEYEKINDDSSKYIMKLSKKTIRKCWFKWSRIWIIKKQNSLSS